MVAPLDIVWKNIDKSETIEQTVRARADELERLCPRIVALHVFIEEPRRREWRGDLLSIRIRIGVPDDYLTVDHNLHTPQRHEEMSIAVAAAFDAARRRVEDYLRARRGQARIEELWPMGEVVRLSRPQRDGVVRTAEGREIHFNAQVVLHGAYDLLEIGGRVRFVEQAGDNGPRASSVRLFARPAPQVA